MTESITITSGRKTFMEVRTMEQDRIELNKAIFVVIVSGNPLKDMKQEVKLIRNAGYQISKYAPHQWRIDNLSTSRHLTATMNWRSGGYQIEVNNTYRKCYRIDLKGCQRRSEYFDRCKIDFVGILESPINHDWIWVLDNRMVGNGWRLTPTMAKYDRLKQAKYAIKWKQDEIKNIQKQIEAAQKSLIYYAGEKAKSERYLQDIRKELGLVRR